MSAKILTEQQVETFLSGDPMTVALAASHEALRADRDRWRYNAEAALRAIREYAAGADAAEARVAELEAFVREPVPFGAYMRWRQDGNTADADAMQVWSDARAAALGAPGGES